MGLFLGHPVDVVACPAAVSEEYLKVWSVASAGVSLEGLELQAVEWTALWEGHTAGLRCNRREVDLGAAAALPQRPVPGQAHSHLRFWRSSYR